MKINMHPSVTYLYKKSASRLALNLEITHLTWFLGLDRVHNPNDILIGSAVFGGLTVMTY